MMKLVKAIMIVVLGVATVNAELVSQWSFDGDLNDSVGSDHGSFLNGRGCKYVTGHDGTGQALHFTNFTTKVSIGVGAAGFNAESNDFTATGWFRMGDIDDAKDRYEAINGVGSYDGIYLKLIANNANNVGGIDAMFNRYGWTNGVGRLTFNMKGLDSDVFCIYPEPTDDGQWHWFAMRVKDRKMSIWLDGEMVDDIDFGANTTMTDSGVRSTLFGGGHDDMVIDDFRVWDEALPEVDLRRDYDPATDSWMMSWGRDAYDQVSDLPFETNIAAIACGPEFSLALTEDGSVLGWGRNNNGQTTVPSGSGHIAIGASVDAGFAIAADTSLVVWGNDYSSGTDCYPRPTGTGFKAVVGGARKWAVAMKNDGSLVAWGYDSGHHNVVDCPTNTPGFTQIAAGYAHGLALDSDGYITTWGDKYEGVNNAPTGAGYVDIAGGSSWSVAINSNGVLEAWGRDFEGQISGLPSGSNYVDVAAGYYDGIAIKDDGTLIAWGKNADGIVTDLPGGSEFTEIALGVGHALALVDFNPLVIPRGTLILLK